MAPLNSASVKCVVLSVSNVGTPPAKLRLCVCAAYNAVLATLPLRPASLWREYAMAARECTVVALTRYVSERTQLRSQPTDGAANMVIYDTSTELLSYLYTYSAPSAVPSTSPIHIST
eukprot:1735093-Pleurochrysis_carterae.AAC.2